METKPPLSITTFFSSSSTPQKRKKSQDEEEETSVISASPFKIDHLLLEPIKNEKRSPETLKIMTWNVAGLNSALKKSFKECVNAEQPDILCLQEIKMDRTTLPLKGLLVDYPFEYYHPCKNRKGYSGTAVFSKLAPLEVRLDIQKGSLLDDEGRVMTLEFNSCFLINAYLPNAGVKLKRLKEKLESFKIWLDHLATLEKRGKHILITGDLNVAHQDMDLARPRSNSRTAGFTNEERQAFTKLLHTGYVDVFRHFHPDVQEYTYWGFRFSAYSKNIGWRLDYYVALASCLPHIQRCQIRKSIYGVSDHVPVLLYCDRNLFE
jgi:exodeoxyribonuclease III